MSVIGVWVNELRKHSPEPFHVETRYGTTDNCGGLIGKNMVFWRIINYEATYDRIRADTEDGIAFRMGEKEDLYDFNPDAIILDESTAIGDPTTKQCIFIFKLVRDLKIPVRITMTGTPWHRKLLMAFGQFKVLNMEIFGTNWGAYKKTYGLWGGYADTKLLKYINLKMFRRKVEPWAFSMKHVPPMKPVHQVIPVPFSEGVERYEQMANEAYLEIAGHEVEASLIITRIRKLVQIANGYVRSTDAVLRTGRDKEDFGKDYLRDLLNQGVRKVVIVVEELPQLLQATRAAKAAGYKAILFYGASENREERIDKFQTGGGHIAMIMQISTGAMGIDLSATDTMVFWTPPTKFLQWDQVCARIRKYKDMRTLAYYYLVTKGTIEEAKYLALQQNIELAKLVGDHPELINYQEIG